MRTNRNSIRNKELYLNNLNNINANCNYNTNNNFINNNSNNEIISFSSIGNKDNFSNDQHYLTTSNADCKANHKKGLSTNTKSNFSRFVILTNN